MNEYQIAYGIIVFGLFGSIMIWYLYKQKQIKSQKREHFKKMKGKNNVIK